MAPPRRFTREELRQHETDYLRRKRRESDNTQCEVDGCFTRAEPLKQKCQKHRKRAARFGHAEVEKLPGVGELHPSRMLARQWLKSNEITPEVLHKLQRFILSSEATYEINLLDSWADSAKLRHAKHVLKMVMAHYRNPRSQKMFSQRGIRRSGSTPPMIVEALLGATIWMEEREWGKGWSGHALLAMTLLSLRRHQPKEKGFTANRVSGPARHLLGQLIGERIGGWLLLSARAILAKPPVVPIVIKYGREAISTTPPTLTKPKLPPLPPEPVNRSITFRQEHAAWLKLKALHDARRENEAVEEGQP